ncbi:hypothetical protein HOY82DRAFT_301624 [Tuber indicum]|nr:hypothetical protein HOY82DRAFT_301624 [Tuber indicum]
MMTIITMTTRLMALISLLLYSVTFFLFSFPSLVHQFLQTSPHRSGNHHITCFFFSSSFSSSFFFLFSPHNHPPTANINYHNIDKNKKSEERKRNPRSARNTCMFRAISIDLGDLCLSDVRFSTNTVQYSTRVYHDHHNIAYLPVYLSAPQYCTCTIHVRMSFGPRYPTLPSSIPGISTQCPRYNSLLACTE